MRPNTPLTKDSGFVSSPPFHQLLQSLSRHDFERLAREHHVGQKLRAASRWGQFVGIAMSQISGRQSLRDIESSLINKRHKLYHLGAKPIVRSNAHKFRFKNPLYSLDASTIDLSLSLFPWAKIHQTKAGGKLHTS